MAVPNKGGTRPIMKLTLASVYALHALAYMAEQKHDRPIASHHIAEAQGIPERFLLKVLKPLVTADPPVLTSIKGPNGGYRLARPASEVNFHEIVEAVDGPVRGNVPMPKPDAKDKRRPLDKTLHNKIEAACKGTAEVVRKYLDKVRISDLAGKKK